MTTNNGNDYKKNPHISFIEYLNDVWNGINQMDLPEKQKKEFFDQCVADVLNKEIRLLPTELKFQGITTIDKFCVRKWGKGIL